MQEFDLIETYFKPLSNKKNSFCLTDDVAKISPKKGKEIVISKDLLIEDVHFKKEDGGHAIACKALLSNLSDLASSGATPLYYMLGFSKNDDLDKNFYDAFALGLKEIQKKYKIKLLGGDTIKSKKLIFSITIFGEVKKDKILLRKNAKKGDLIYVSGNIGDSYLGLLNKNDKYFSQKHFLPTPQIKLGQALLKNKLSQCAIDISDGLLADLNHICNSSKLSANIFLNQIPISNQAARHLKNNKKIKILDLISAGEDYELIFSANEKDAKKIEKLAKKLKLPLKNIGFFDKKTNKTPNITIFDKNNKIVKFKKLGYVH